MKTVTYDFVSLTLLFKCTQQGRRPILYVIDQIRGRVFHQDIQTPRSVLKNEAVG